MRNFLSLSAIPIVFIQAAPNLAQVPPTAVVVQFPEVGLAIAQPQGFEKAQNFYGFQQPKTGSSIVLSALPGPFNQVTNFEFTGMRLLSEVYITISGQQGILLQVAQSAHGQDFLKWMVVFGNQNRTYFVTASFLDKSDPELSTLLRQTVLSTSILEGNSLKASKLPFSVDPVPGLLPAPQAALIGKAAAFTKDGKLASISLNDPLFIVAPSLGPVPVLDQRLYALKRIRQFPKISVKQVDSTAPIAVDGLSGYEILATGTDQGSGTSIKIYQVMLFPKTGGYVIMTGLVGESLAALYLPKFKVMAKTYRKVISAE